ncbi:hypothetical protein PAPHI01_0116 [Pancytospora philotis]|nr:hypothetical protein PAPHI01_0116 [Pancytospora philotis]
MRHFGNGAARVSLVCSVLACGSVRFALFLLSIAASSPAALELCLDFPSSGTEGRVDVRVLVTEEAVGKLTLEFNPSGQVRDWSEVGIPRVNKSRFRAGAWVMLGRNIYLPTYEYYRAKLVVEGGSTFYSKIYWKTSDQFEESTEERMAKSYSNALYSGLVVALLVLALMLVAGVCVLHQFKKAERRRDAV